MIGSQEVRDRVGCLESPRAAREMGKMMSVHNDSSGRRRRLI